MRAKELLDQGQLSAAIDQLGNELREHPGDRVRRRFLFELLCFKGDLERAERQLETLGHLDESVEGMAGVQLLKCLLATEKSRRALFQAGVRPRFLLEPSPDVLRRLEALELARQGRHQEAWKAIEQAEAQRRLQPGRAGEASFGDLRDGDDILAPVLEVVTAAGYFWVPWEQVQYLEVPPPRQLRDLYWAPANLAAWDGQMGEVYLPMIYPGSHASAEELVQLGRVTDWREEPSGMVRGLGQKLFLVDNDAKTLHELGMIQFQKPADLEN